MSIINEVEIALSGIQNILDFIEKIDPNFANNPIVIDLQKALNVLKSLGA